MFRHKPDPEVVVQINSLTERVDALAQGLALMKDFAGVTKDRFNAQSDMILNLTENLKIVTQEVSAMRQDWDAIEEKLDELLKAQDTADRSIPGDEGKAPKEPTMEFMPGRIPWSQRKARRVRSSRSAAFIDKITKAAATTEPKKEGSE